MKCFAVRTLFAFIALALASLTTAHAIAIPDSPEALAAIEPRAGTCDVVVKIVNVLKLFKATPFCSKFLSIKPTTTTLTKTQTVTTAAAPATTVVATVTVPTSTSTATVTTTDTSAITTSTTNNVVTATSNTVVTVTNPTQTVTVTVDPPAKRAVEVLEERAEPIPAWLKAFKASAISSACKCLSIPTPTATVTSTATQSVLTTGTISVTSTTGTVTVTTTTLTTSSTRLTVVTEPSTTTTVVSSTVTLSPTQTVTCVSCTGNSNLVANGGFESGSSGSQVDNWSLSDTGGGVILRLRTTPFSGGLYYLWYNSDPGPSTGSAVQTLNVCPNRSYVLRFTLFASHGGIPSNPQTTLISITIGGRLVWGPAKVCPSVSDCMLDEGSDYYRAITVPVGSFETCNPQFRVLFESNVPRGVQQWNAAIDGISLTP
ncbi:hypothetical protein BKA66DRAFT_571457 [Pyrenochaeta sp. MPI-SDFR-AT-0127]|nr:hypothetical protein BKA66DRAFT_571457 [Pyrenochaeta sp. MPI-SDFR-AT-0127]